jgi:hypothetical protein
MSNQPQIVVLAQQEIADTQEKIDLSASKVDGLVNQVVNDILTENEAQAELAEKKRRAQEKIDKANALKERFTGAIEPLASAKVSEPTVVPVTEPDVPPAPVVVEAPVEPAPTTGPEVLDLTRVTQPTPVAPVVPEPAVVPDEPDVSLSGEDASPEEQADEPKWRRILGPLKDWHVIAWSLAFLAFFVTFVVMAGVGSPNADKNSVQWLVDLMFYWIVPIAVFLAAGSFGSWIERKNASRQ